MNWVSLHNHSHFSLLDGKSQIKDIVKKCIKCNYKSVALSDHGTISGCVEFYKECKKEDIKPILGIEAYISPLDCKIKDNNNRKLSHLPMLAKNLAGWKTLLKIVTKSNDEENFYYKPRLDLNTLGEILDSNIISFSGHLGSDLSNCLFHDKQSYDGKLRSDALQVGCRWAEKYRELFGKDNFFIEIQLIDKENSPNAVIVADILREVSKRTDIPCIGTADSHYPDKKDARDQRVLLCSAMRTTFDKANNGESGLSGFFNSDNFHIPSLEEMQANHTEEELDNTVLIADMCEDYDIFSKPKLSPFKCPNGMTEIGYLKELCNRGWESKLGHRDINKEKYRGRLDFEFGVVERADLAGYFLVVQDFVNLSKQQGWLLSPGRGSASGCLISYLCNITNINPIPHNLLFSRFYNEGRNTENHVSLPDIDIDVPSDKREKIIQYLSDKYGKENVAQIGTFGRLQAKAVIREVLRVHDACPHEIINRISKVFPPEGVVSDKMQADGESSLIMWTLKHQPERLRDYCYLTDDGKLEGEFAHYFEQALRLEGTYKSQGKHAAGVIVAGEPISNFIPVVSTKSGKVTGFEMNDCEAVGGVKLDILGNNCLDKLNYTNELLSGVYINEVNS